MTTDIEKSFTYQDPKGDQVDRYVKIRNAGKELALFITSTCPESRERSLAVTKLQECIMWANASIALNE